MLGNEVRNYQYPVGSSASCSTQSPRAPPSVKFCSNSCCGSISSLVSSLGVCLLVLGYTLLGALTFMALEGRGPAASNPGTASEARSPEHDQLRSQTVEKLWSITEDLNILYKDNWTRLAEQEVLKFQNSLVRKYRQTGAPQKTYNWSFPSAFLYSLTLITTIGYGNVTPRTAWGRLITIAYAIIGIPLMLVYLSTVGDTLARHFRQLYGRVWRPSRRRDKKREAAIIPNHVPEKKHRPPSPTSPCTAEPRQRIPVCLTLSVVVGYVSGGAFLFNRLENWSFIEGSYFCFTSLGTIGFGELVPGSRDAGNELSVFASSAFILIGMAVIAMCFNLVQDETVTAVRRLSGWWGRPDGPEEERPPGGVKSS